MISQHDHMARILRLITPLPIDEVPLAQALGQTLATNVISTTDLPPWNAAAMDGYAVNLEQFTPGTIPVSEVLAAGHQRHERLAPGQVAAIMTGAAVPDGADTVIPLEQFHAPTQEIPTHITFDAIPEPHQNIRRRAEDTTAGEIIVAAGTLLKPNHIGAIAATGHATVFTARKPRVAVISTGNELVAPGTPLQHGQIPDSNAPLVAATLEKWGAHVTHQLRVRDSQDSLEHTIAQLEHTVDAMILTGGASVGAHDISNYILSAWEHEQPESSIQFTSVNIRPGKPQGFGLSPAGTPVWSLPGNPVAVLVSLQLFVAPGLAKMQRQAPVRYRQRLLTTENLHVPKPLHYYFLAVQHDATHAAPLPSGSHLAATMAKATGLFHVPPDVGSVAAQSWVEYLPL